MSALLILLIITVIISGLIAGLSFDVALVKLPTRHRIGYEAYAQFARGNDLGNGIVVYPVMGVLAVLLIAATTIVAYIYKLPSSALYLLDISVVLTIVHSGCSAIAAPIMLSLKHTPDDEAILKRKLDRFAFWHGFRASFQLLTFIVLVVALAEAMCNLTSCPI